MFDGRSAAGRAVRLRIDGNELVADHDAGAPLRWPLKQVRWPERTRHGQRVLHIDSGEWLQCADSNAFDTWAAAAGRRDSLVVRSQQNWRAVAAAVLGSIVVLAAGYVWGLPLAARWALVLIPESADRAVGVALLRQLDERWMKPTKVPPERQAAIRAAFAQAAARAYPGQPLYGANVEFRFLIDPNALALPGGTIIVTDALVDLLKDRDDVLLGVLGHELGHVRARHGMRMLVQASAVAAVVGLIIGDFSSLLAVAPTVLAQLSYARDIEREADAVCAHVLRAAGYAPAAMVVFFERIRKNDGGAPQIPIGLASHPDIDERIRYFTETAQR